MGQWDLLSSSCHAPNDLPSSAKAHVSACDQGVYLPGTDRPSETPGLPGQGWPERGHVPQPRCQAGAEPAEGEGVMGSHRGCCSTSDAPLSQQRRKNPQEGLYNVSRGAPVPWEGGGGGAEEGPPGSPGPGLRRRDITPGPAMPAGLRLCGRKPRLRGSQVGRGLQVRLQLLWGARSRGLEPPDLPLNDWSTSPSRVGSGVAVGQPRGDSCRGDHLLNHMIPGPLVSLHRPAWVAFG